MIFNTGSLLALDSFLTVAPSSLPLLSCISFVFLVPSRLLLFCERVFSGA